MLRILRSAVEIPHEVIVITDTSDDLSIPVIQGVAARYAEVRHVTNSLGRGVANAIRAGITAARGQYVLIFAADEVGPVIAVHRMLDDGRKATTSSASTLCEGGRAWEGRWGEPPVRTQSVFSVSPVSLSDATTA